MLHSFSRQGVTKTFVRDGLFAFLIKRSKTPKFLAATNRVLADVKSLNLDWLKVEPISNDKLGNYVGDTLLGLSRLLKHIVSSVAPVVAETWKEPTSVGGAPLAQDRWVVKANRMWLKIRGIHTEGTAQELRDRVREEKSKHPVPPILEGLGGSVAGVETVAQALLAMLARLMAEKVSPDTVKVNI